MADSLDISYLIEKTEMENFMFRSLMAVGAKKEHAEILGIKIEKFVKYCLQFIKTDFI